MDECPSCSITSQQKKNTALAYAGRLRMWYIRRGVNLAVVNNCEVRVEGWNPQWCLHEFQCDYALV